jgi:recombination protein RecR
MILKMINNRQELLKPLAQNISEVFKNVIRCKICGTLKSNKSLCDNCENKSKKFNKICVVENISDQWAIESSSIFQGYFHILGGTLSNNNSQNKEDLLINSLVERISRDNIDEVILATSATVEGQTTAFYIQDSLKKTNIKISKLAQGLPVGGEIENLDDGTLISAFKNRKKLEA